MAETGLDWRVLEERVRESLRIEHYSYSTEQTYVGWIRRYVAFHGWRKPSTLEAPDVLNKGPMGVVSPVDTL